MTEDTKVEEHSGDAPKDVPPEAEHADLRHPATWLPTVKVTAAAILLVSLELDEILSLSDRILVMYEGEIVGEYPPTATEQELGIAMTGGGRDQGEEEAA